MPAPLTPAERQRAFRERKAAAGQLRLSIRLGEVGRQRLAKLAEALNCTQSQVVGRLLKDAERGGAYKAGYLAACLNLMHLHAAAEIASDVLFQAGITEADVAAMHLADDDRRALDEIRLARQTDAVRSS